MPPTEALQMEGPVPGAALPATYDLGVSAYREEEFILAGTAHSVELVGERSADGRWAATPAGAAPFKTRVLVRRPIDPSRFGGTVFVEWLNVSGNTDAAPDWSYLHREIVRRGGAWVGVSAQKVGIEGGGTSFMPDASLKRLAPDRYGSLAHPGDAFSYDMFTQAGRCLAANDGRGPLGPLGPRRLVAIGESQSAAFLVTYINAIDSLERVFDGYFVHGRPAAGAALDGFRLIPRDGGELDANAVRRQQAPERIRPDARCPVLVLQSETDVLSLGSGRAQQEDGEQIRLWEVAGAAHADSYLLLAAQSDTGSLPAAEMARLIGTTVLPAPMTTDVPINSGPQQHYVGQAGLRALERWVAEGLAPPGADRLTVQGDGFATDEHGVARGGVRTPWVEVPAAVLSGLGQSGTGFAFLFGTTRPLDAAARAGLYPRRPGRVSRPFWRRPHPGHRRRFPPRGRPGRDRGAGSRLVSGVREATGRRPAARFSSERRPYAAQVHVFDPRGQVVHARPVVLQSLRTGQTPPHRPAHRLQPDGT